MDASEEAVDAADGAGDGIGVSGDHDDLDGAIGAPLRGGIDLGVGRRAHLRSTPPRSIPPGGIRECIPHGGIMQACGSPAMLGSNGAITAFDDHRVSEDLVAGILRKLPSVTEFEL
ncbi:hypothetical protein [Mycobacterium sp. AMU20-3851]|uniref:hypothetical protein n=1 Tax=Mycobacterium sp. AMU20-3851 TaxID=3122055 RepID=UPI0037549F09